MTETHRDDLEKSYQDEATLLAILFVGCGTLFCLFIFLAYAHGAIWYHTLSAITFAATAALAVRWGSIEEARSQRAAPSKRQPSFPLPVQSPGAAHDVFNHSVPTVGHAAGE